MRDSPDDERTGTIQGVPQPSQREGLPAMQPASDAEEPAIADTGLIAFVTAPPTPQVVRRTIRSQNK